MVVAVPLFLALTLSQQIGVEGIDVLGSQGQGFSSLIEILLEHMDGKVTFVGLALRDKAEDLPVPAPEKGGVLMEFFTSEEFFGGFEIFVTSSIESIISSESRQTARCRKTSSS